MNNKYFGFNDDDLIFLFGKNKNKAMKSLEALFKTHPEYTDYEALEAALHSFKTQAIEKGFKNVGVPYKLGCGLAGGDWDGVVYPMLQRVFNDDSITLWIVKLPTA